MGITYVEVELYNPKNDGEAVVRSFLVDSGATYSVVPGSTLAALGIEPQRPQRFLLANGDVLERGVGEAGFRFQGEPRTSPVVFGDADDVYLLGAVTLETLGYMLDPFRRELLPLRLMMA
jgi:predicted aspartyl protease